MANNIEPICVVNDKETTADLRGKILCVEKIISQLPDAKFDDDTGELVHTFADGLYIRQYTGWKGTLVVSKLHKTTHPYFVLSGDASVVTDEGMVRITAPHWGITEAGTKRVLYFHEDTVWITVHATEETDLEKIEDKVIAKNYSELPEDVKARLGIKVVAEIERKQLCPGEQ